MKLWAEVEARNWEERNSDIAVHEMNQEFESQRFQQHQASRWADQAQRDKNQIVWRIGIEKLALPRKSFKGLARNCRNEKNLLRRS